MLEGVGVQGDQWHAVFQVELIIQPHLPDFAVAVREEKDRLINSVVC